MNSSRSEEQCDHCSAALSTQRVELERRVDYISKVDDPDTGENGETEVVAGSAELVRSYCHIGCWRAREGEVIAELRLRYPYPDDSLVSRCSRCGSMLVRLKPHVSYSILEGSICEQPWLTTVDVHHCQYLAHLCPECEPPTARWAAAEGEELPISDQLEVAPPVVKEGTTR